MKVLPSFKKVVLGTSKGRLLVMDKPIGISITNSSSSLIVVQTVAVHEDEVSSLAIGASQDVMVSASEDETIHVWPTESLEDNSVVFEGHTDRLYSVALRTGGRLLASVSWDGSVRSKAPFRP